MQLRIEAQGNYLQAVLEKAQETLGKQNLGTVGLEATKVQLSELASTVSTQCPDSKFSELKELPALWPPQTRASDAIDCSMGSFLTFSEESHRDQEMNNKGLNFRAYNATPFSVSKESVGESRLSKSDMKLCEQMKEKMMFLSSTSDRVEKGNFIPERTSNFLSMNIGVEEEEEEEDNFGRTETRPLPVKLNHEKISQDYRMANFQVKLDLNAHDDNDASSHCQQLDLNGFNWNC